MEIVEADHEAGGPVVPTNVRVNGIDVGLLAKAPKISMDADEATTVTLVLLPSSVEVKGDGVRADRKPIGFTAE
ncbi:hypothetical protein [Streptomyces sp. ITFR-6]|uniref:hypothetical protein n=1 Tax=Streptomyces sp. ITFR-6 TaxID=3075197 RepID=UPI00288AC53E|nr:hypothetical protein [Streptomyces sp. ITFR-6]WNI28677.1 hypothetical protein RLT59_07630 [Streptomyces sp. ITFR-6]